MDFWNGLARMEWAGKGQVVCPHGQARACDFAVAQLINGNVVVHIFNVEQPLSAQDWLLRHPSLALVGTFASGRQIRVTDFRIITPSGLWPEEARYEGFLAPSATVELWNPDATLPPHDLTALLTNVVLAGPHDSIRPTVAGIAIEIGDAAQFRANQRFARALKTTSVRAVLKIPLSPPHAPEQAEALVHDLCGLLSFAQRSLVSCVALIWRDEAGQVVQQRLQLPYFYYPAATRPLIPPAALAGFLEATYDNYRALRQPWNLGQALDHYVQAMVLRSAWTQSLGFFTALETLKWAFLKQPAHKHRGQSVAPPASRMEKVAEQVKAKIDELPHLSEEEKAFLKEQVAALQHRPYKVVLADLFENLGMEVDRRELDELVGFRNRVVHRGHPDDKDTRTAFSRATRFAGLVERLICTILGYQGEMELYNQGTKPIEDV